MNFKDQVYQDRDIFINPDEFAEMHDLNGIRCMSIIQSPTAQESFLTSETYQVYDGIHGELRVIHCRAADLPDTPVEGQVFHLDGAVYIVDSCISDMGMLTITLHGEMR